jgi:hypothetical protein
MMLSRRNARPAALRREHLVVRVLGFSTTRAGATGQRTSDAARSW